MANRRRNTRRRSTRRSNNRRNSRRNNYMVGGNADEVNRIINTFFGSLVDMGRQSMGDVGKSGYEITKTEHVASIDAVSRFYKMLATCAGKFADDNGFKTDSEIVEKTHALLEAEAADYTQAAQNALDE